MRVALDVEVASDPRLIAGVVAQVTSSCAGLALSPRALALQVPVALAEALANAMRYGNALDAAKRVRVRVAVTDAAVVLEVHDEGAGFDLGACLRDPTAPDRLEAEDGRGLFLMRSLMDRLECEAGRGGVVRMTLFRA